MRATDNKNHDGTAMVPGKLGKWNDLEFHCRTNLLAKE